MNEFSWNYDALRRQERFEDLLKKKLDHLKSRLLGEHHESWSRNTGAHCSDDAGDENARYQYRKNMIAAAPATPHRIDHITYHRTFEVCK